MPEVRNVQDKTTGTIAMTGRVSNSQVNTRSPEPLSHSQALGELGVWDELAAR